MPNGTLFAGDFQNNKPLGQGSWQFKNGNETKGEYTQRVKERADDEEEPAPEEDGQPAAKKLELVWQPLS